MSTARRASTLDAATTARLRAAAFTYPHVGASDDAVLPAGWDHLDHSALVSPDPADLDELAGRLLRWQAQLGAGLRVAASDPVAVEGTVAVLRLGPLPIPVRVVRVIDEPDRRGFLYGTLPGHPENGEELFVLERSPDGVRMVVRAFSRPAGLLLRLGGPVARRAQGLAARRYVRALG